MIQDIPGIAPHGGRLVDRHASRNDADELFSIVLPDAIINDIENIADGILSPLEGFLVQDDFESVVSRGRLADDTAWTIPIVLNSDRETAQRMRDAGEVLIKSRDGTPAAVLHPEDAYRFDMEETCRGVFGTTDEKHPGVSVTRSLKECMVGGKIEMISRPADAALRRHRKTPMETRKIFADADWKTIVAFQTRNPPHVAHEMLQKTSITTRDGVFVNPLVGKKKPGDFVDEVILDCYEKMIDLYYAENRCRLATLHTEMRYAGPREAIHHAIMRQNYGCTHIIIGRDHAGVGKYYEPYAAQEIFSEYGDLEIAPVFFPAFFYCRECLTYTTFKACPHGDDSKEQISGTEMREMIRAGRPPSKFILRPEVSRIILDHPSPFVE